MAKKKSSRKKQASREARRRQNIEKMNLKPLNKKASTVRERISYLGKIRGDEDIRYVRITDTIHDKSCRQLNVVNDKNLIELERYDRLLSQCSDCAMRSYIRVGCLDFDRITFYEKVYKQGKVSVDILKEMYVDNGMTTHFENNTLHIHYKEDDWKIEFDTYSAFKRAFLFHNNYYVDENGKRFIREGYHKQIKEWTSTADIMMLIKNYSYEEHKKMEKEREEAEENKRNFSLNNIRDNLVLITNNEEVLDTEVPKESPLVVTNENTDIQKAKKPQLSLNCWETLDDYRLIERLADIRVYIDEICKVRNIDKKDLEDLVRIKEKYQGTQAC